MPTENQNHRTIFYICVGGMVSRGLLAEADRLLQAQSEIGLWPHCGAAGTLGQAGIGLQLVAHVAASAECRQLEPCPRRGCTWWLNASATMVWGPAFGAKLGPMFGQWLDAGRMIHEGQTVSRLGNNLRCLFLFI